MKLAKIIRHRHKWTHSINEDVKDVTEEVHYKIVFSDPDEFDRFTVWVKDNGGSYEYDKDLNQQKGELPKLKAFEGKNPCFCDIMSFYLLELAGYYFHSVTSPYRGEIYHK